MQIMDATTPNHLTRLTVKYLRASEAPIRTHTVLIEMVNPTAIYAPGGVAFPYLFFCLVGSFILASLGSSLSSRDLLFFLVFTHWVQNFDTPAGRKKETTIIVTASISRVRVGTTANVIEVTNASVQGTTG